MRFKRREWGYYIVLWRRPKFKVKILKFRAGESISLQKHKFRNELWLILKGQGKNMGYPYKRGDFLMIGKHEWHKFTARKKTTILEIQFGEVCDENDIERKDV